MDMQNLTTHLTNFTDISNENTSTQILTRFENGIVESWSFAFATGHVYKVHVDDGKYWTSMRILPGPLYEAGDAPIILNFNLS
jgi:hypothetical protein